MFEKFLSWLVALPLVIVLFALMTAIDALIVQYLWNYIVSNQMFAEFYQIGFLKAWAITVLCKFLFKK